MPLHVSNLNKDRSWEWHRQSYISVSFQTTSSLHQLLRFKCKGETMAGGFILLSEAHTVQLETSTHNGWHANCLQTCYSITSWWDGRKKKKRLISAVCIKMTRERVTRKPPSLHLHKCTCGGTDACLCQAGRQVGRQACTGRTDRQDTHTTCRSSFLAFTEQQEWMTDCTATVGQGAHGKAAEEQHHHLHHLICLMCKKTSQAEGGGGAQTTLHSSLTWQRSMGHWTNAVNNWW